MKRSLSIAGAIGMILAATAVFAQPKPCELVDGCTPVNTFLNFVGPLINLFIYGIAGVAVLMVMWGGAQMLVSLGDENRITTGRHSIEYALAGFAVALGAQTIVAFVASRAPTESANPLVDTIDVAVSTMLYLFNFTFVVVIIITGLRLVIGRGKSEEFDAARRMLIFAVVGAIFINVSKSLVTGILQLGI